MVRKPALRVVLMEFMAINQKYLCVFITDGTTTLSTLSPYNFLLFPTAR